MRPKIKTEMALAYIREHGTARAKQIAAHLDSPVNSAAVLLKPYVDNGTLISCVVTVPGENPQTEYRFSARGPVTVANAEAAGSLVRTPQPGIGRTKAMPAAKQEPASEPPAPPAATAPEAAVPAWPGPRLRRIHFSCALYGDGKLIIERDSLRMELSAWEAQTIADLLTGRATLPKERR